MTEPNGIADDHVEPTPRYHFALTIATTAPLDQSAEGLQLLGDAIWRALPSAHDGDVFLTPTNEDLQ